MTVWLPNDTKFYVFRYQIDGEKFNGPTGCTNKRDAERFRDNHKRETKRKFLLQPREADGTASLTVVAAISKYNDEMPNRHPQTMKSEEIWFEHISLSLGLHTLMRDVTTSMVDKMVKQLSKRPKTKFKGALGTVTLLGPNGEQLRNSNAYLNRYTWKLFRRVHEMTRTKEWSPVRPIAWKEVALREKETRVGEIKVEEEISFTNDKGFREGYGAAFRFGLMSGLRKSNLILEWTQVDFDNRTIDITQKGDRPHTIQIDDEMMELLKAERGKHPTYVFTYLAQRTRKNPKTRKAEIKGQRYPLTVTGFDSWFKRQCAKLKIKATPHVMRHTHGSRLLRNGANLKAVSQRLGHSDVGITAKIYAHVTPDDMLDVINDANKRQKQRELNRKASGEKTA